MNTPLNAFAVLVALSGSVAVAAVDPKLKAIGMQTLRGEIEDMVQLQATGGIQYLAALYDVPGVGPKVAVIRKVGQGYTVIYDEGTCCTVNDDLRLTDLNKDGVPEVFYAGASGGSGLTSYDFYLTDLKDRQMYHANIVVGNNSGRGVLQYDPALLKPERAAFLNFMQPAIERSEGFKATKLPPTLAELWTNQYGRFALGQWAKVQIKPNPAPLTSAACDTPRAYLKALDASTSATVGGVTYIAAFKGPVYAVNKAKGRCYVIYMPETYYDWIAPLKARADGSLALYDRSDARKVVYFNPKTNTLWR